jgi:hypothetical protein
VCVDGAFCLGAVAKARQFKTVRLRGKMATRRGGRAEQAPPLQTSGSDRGGGWLEEVEGVHVYEDGGLGDFLGVGVGQGAGEDVGQDGAAWGFE